MPTVFHFLFNSSLVVNYTTEKHCEINQESTSLHENTSTKDGYKKFVKMQVLSWQKPFSVADSAAITKGF
jgi:heme oxygenase